MKELTSKPFGVNILKSGKNADNQLLLIIVYEEKVPVVMIYYDAPKIAEDTIKDLKAHNVTVNCSISSS